MAAKEVIWDEFGWLVMAEEEQIRRNIQGRLAGVLLWFWAEWIDVGWLEWILCVWLPSWMSVQTPPLQSEFRAPPLAGEAHFSLLLPTAPADPYLSAHACLPMLGCPCLLDHACLPMLVYPCLPAADKYMCGCPCLAHGSRDVVTLKVMAANMTFLWT